MWELASRPLAGLAGALTSRQLLTAIRSAGLSTSHLTRQQLTCQSDLQLPPAAGLLVELIGTLGKLQVTIAIGSIKLAPGLLLVVQKLAGYVVLTE